VGQTLVKKYQMKDLVTHEIFEDLLKHEISDENWENFLPTSGQGYGFTGYD
jgi:hypothetical protein